MKRLLYILLITASGLGMAQEKGVSSIEQTIEDVFGPLLTGITNVVFTEVASGVPLVLVWLLLGALFFTIYNGFFNFRGFTLAINVVRGVFTDPNDKGEVSHFQALTTALSATVGLGNIAGVAIAIQLGGPGATFWMILAGLLGMSSKMVECTLGVKYRDIDENGVVYGGPMHYLSKGLAERGLTKLGKVLAVVFAVCCIGGSFGGGNMFQVNQAWQQTSSLFNLESGSLLYGFVMAAIVAVVIIGGVKRIASVTEKIVPFMCGIYVLCALIIIFSNFTKLPHTIGLIIGGAFNFEAGFGGFIGVLIVGFKRAAFSNEAGIGSAAIAHSAVKTNEPMSEGVVALLEPFIDTVVVCTMTALVIIITGTYADTSITDGIALTNAAFVSVIGFFNVFLWVAVTLFAFSTMISWSYYGLQSWTYLFGHSKGAGLSYKVLFLCFIVLGATMGLKVVVGFSDAMIFAMSFPNVLGLYILAPSVRRDLHSYITRIKSGEIKRHK